MFKPVVIEQNGQKVLVGFVPADATSVVGAEICSLSVSNHACPEVGADIREFIDSNPQRSFDLHKVVNGQIVCRTVEELKNSTFIDWQYNWEKYVAPIDPPEVG